MSTLLSFGRDAQGLNAYAPQFPVDIYTSTLADEVAATVTVPANSPVWIMYVRIQPSGWVYCSRNQNATLPLDGTLTQSSSELITGTIEYKRTVYKDDVISFITPNTTCDIEVAFYQVSYP